MIELNVSLLLNIKYVTLNGKNLDNWNNQNTQDQEKTNRIKISLILR
jgi:hypothetical protein